MQNYSADLMIYAKRNNIDFVPDGKGSYNIKEKGSENFVPLKTYAENIERNNPIFRELTAAVGNMKTAYQNQMAQNLAMLQAREEMKAANRRGGNADEAEYLPEERKLTSEDNARLIKEYGDTVVTYPQEQRIRIFDIEDTLNALAMQYGIASKHSDNSIYIAEDRITPETAQQLANVEEKLFEEADMDDLVKSGRFYQLNERIKNKSDNSRVNELRKMRRKLSERGALFDRTQKVRSINQVIPGGVTNVNRL